MQSENDKPSVWWGSYDFGVEQAATWEIGTVRFQARRLEREWQVITDKLDAEIDGWHFAESTEPLDDTLPRHRVVFRETGPTLHISPRLADRPVVARPAVPFSVPPGEEATLFVSSPVWAHLQAHAERVSLHEVALQRPSDTWFGPTTGGSGELCYASRTQGRLALDEVPRRMHRAITPVVLRNHAGSAFAVERVNLPVTYLSLYQGPNGYLWTPEITLRRDEDEASATIDIGDGAPEPVREAILVEGPRVVPEGRTLLRAVTSLFG